MGITNLSVRGVDLGFIDPVNVTAAVFYLDARVIEMRYDTVIKLSRCRVT